jgi:hypothetical protein
MNEERTFLGEIYGIPITAETKDEVLIQQIGKYLQEARDAWMKLQEEKPRCWYSPYDTTG